MSLQNFFSSRVGVRPEHVAVILTNAGVKGRSKSPSASYKWGMVKADTSFSLRVNGEIRLECSRYYPHIAVIDRER
jgi:hypothetical protein